MPNILPVYFTKSRYKMQSSVVFTHFLKYLKIIYLFFKKQSANFLIKGVEKLKNMVYNISVVM